VKEYPGIHPGEGKKSKVPENFPLGRRKSCSCSSKFQSAGSWKKLQVTETNAVREDLLIPAEFALSLIQTTTIAPDGKTGVYHIT